ncbi:MAG TPA: Ig domain-containing protein [Fimbriimonadaceae bacterium]|nr:Ig domain-containing protein [Fimbriimonadaceae bacterium]
MWGLLLPFAFLVQPRPDPIRVLDTFGRDIKTVGITLVDWEGYLANPAIRIEVRPEQTYLPGRIRLSANSPFLAFDLFSETSPSGPSKTLFLNTADKSVSFRIAAFPDRNTESETAKLTVEYTDANESVWVTEIPVRILDQDRERPIEFPILVDDTHDALGFLADPTRRRIFESAANDWAYFFAPPEFDEVPAGAETGHVWGADGFVKRTTVKNASPYRGFQLFVHGMRHPDLRSGGAAGDLGPEQTIDGKKTGLKRSGTISIEVRGNYNENGWQFSDRDDEWAKSGNMRRDSHDFYSIMRHEIGHALLYHRVHPAFAAKLKGNRFIDPAVRAYLGSDPVCNDVEHFTGVIDPVSRVGMFGNEYGGDMPRKRWMLTKLDLLIAQAVGYRLRDTTPFHRLKLSGPAEVLLTRGVPESLSVLAQGGIPAYDFRVVDGKLPAGLSLDRFTGVVAGTPTETTGSATIGVFDQDPATPVARWNIRFRGPEQRLQ